MERHPCEIVSSSGNPAAERFAKLLSRDVVFHSPAFVHPVTGGTKLQVLQLVSTGMSNRKIAAELVLSERTVDRQLSNIFTKLRVSSRAAATAYAYQHDLVGAAGRAGR